MNDDLQNKNILSNKPVKGTSDWLPDEFAIRKYIFDTWRKVCVSFGYQEYLTPIVETADIYRAKSGEDVGGKELMTMTDRAGRELAIRPEMTPSVTRLVSRIYESTPKPIRLFSIANFLRNEQPQRGRNREFWQLNADIFGTDMMNSDLEILQIALEIMFKFDAPKDSFALYINDRELIDTFVQKYFEVGPELVQSMTRLLDKFVKLERAEFVSEIKKLGGKIRDEKELEDLFAMEDEAMARVAENYLKNVPGMRRLQEIDQKMTSLGYGEWVKWNPGLMRGFDYYDGMVFEVFDKHPQNSRAMFGGGRYNGLASIFGAKSFPAVGFAPGDETTKLFLESWNLTPNIKGYKSFLRIFIPALTESSYMQIVHIANKLRNAGNIVEVGVELQSVGKALDYANRQKFDEVIIIGDDEIKSGKYTIKNMETGEQRSELI